MADFSPLLLLAGSLCFQASPQRASQSSLAFFVSQALLLVGLSLFLLVLEVLGLLVLPLGLELPRLLFGYQAGLQFHPSLVCETTGQQVPLPDTLLGEG